MKLQHFILSVCLCIAAVMVGLVYLEANLILSNRFQEIERSYEASVRESVANTIRVKSQELKLAGERANRNSVARHFLLRSDPGEAATLRKELESIKSAAPIASIDVISMEARTSESPDGLALDSKAIRAARNGKSTYAVSGTGAPKHLVLYFPVKLFRESVAVGIATLSLQEGIAATVQKSSGASIQFIPADASDADSIKVELGGTPIVLGLRVSSRFAAENSYATSQMVWSAAGYLLLLMAGLYWALQFLIVRALNAHKSALTALRDSLQQGRAEVQRGRFFPIREMTDLSHSVADVSQSIQGFQNRIEIKTRTETVGEKTAQIAHDLKGPLAALSAALDLEMIQEFSASKKEAIRTLLNRMRAIASAVAKESVATSGADRSILNDNSEPEDISVAVDEIAAEKTAQYADHDGLSILVANAPQTAFWARVPSQEFQRVLSNLIDNAAESIVGTGTVTISIAQVQNKTAVTIADTGIGIPEHELGKIGERGLSIGKPDGSGLGLWHARKTVEMLGGALQIDSTPGMGTSVVVNLPQCSPAAWFTSEIAISEIHDVVILDDEDWVHSMWAERINTVFPLKRRPKLHHCKTEQQFIEVAAIHKNKPGAVFLCDQNIQAGGLTGLEIIEELGIAPASILVTGNYHDQTIRKRCQKLGVRLISKGQISSVPIRCKELQTAKNKNRSKRSRE